MENVPPPAMNGDDLPSLDDLLRSKRNVKSSRPKRSLALNARANADNDDESTRDDSGLLTPPSSQQEEDMDPAKMLFSPPPEEELRHERNATSRARSAPAPQFTPSLLADPPGSSSSKRKRNAHNRSASHTTLSSLFDDPSTSIQATTEATPNPKPRKQSKRTAPSIIVESPTRSSTPPANGALTPTRSSSQRRSQSPSKRTLQPSPHHTNPNADYILPLPIISQQSLSARRRSATPIPPYEPPRERFTPPREIIHTPPGAGHSPSKVSKSSKRKSIAPKSAKKLVLVIKKEPPEVDLSAPPPPPSPTDDPLLLKGEDRPVRHHTHRAGQASTSSSTHARDTPSIASSSPVSPSREDQCRRLPDLNTSMDVSMQDGGYDSVDDSFASTSAPVFDFANLPDNNTGWNEDDSDDSDDLDDFDQAGEYTGRFKVFTVPTKADPPSSCTRTRQQAWGHPISPFPGSTGRRTSLPSSPPLRVQPETATGSESHESPDEDDVFFLDGPADADASLVTETDTSQQTIETPNDSMEVHDTHRAHTPVRSPSPLPIVDALEAEDMTAVHHPSDHHVRFAARHPSDDREAEEQDDISMEDMSPEQDASRSTSSIPTGPSPESDGEGASMFVDSAPSDHQQSLDGHDLSDSSDEETVDRELSREPDPESDDEDRPPRPTVLTPPRATTPARALSPSTGEQVRTRAFLSITSPLRRHKSPQAQGGFVRSVSPMAPKALPSIESVFTTPGTVRASRAEASPEPSGSNEREATQETAVDEEEMEIEEGPHAEKAATTEEGSGDESEELDAGVIQITSEDPRAAARAAAILKMHDYDFIIKDPSRKRRYSSIDSAMRRTRRKSVMEGGIGKRGTPTKRRRTIGGVTGDKVIIPGSPAMTVPELLQEAERTVEQRERSLHTPARGTPSLNDTTTFSLPLDRPNAFETPGPRQRVHSRPLFNPTGPRSWEKDDWKLLDACFTDERLALGSHKRPLGEAVLAPADDVDLDRVVDRYFEQTGGVPVDDCWPGWGREDLLRRTKALQKKQRSGKVAPPTPSSRFGSMALSEVPDFTPIPSRQSSSLPGLIRTESTTSTQSTKPPVPASLLAPRYAHLLDEAIAISKGESNLHYHSQPVEYRSASMPAPETCNTPVHTEANQTVEVLAQTPVKAASNPAPDLPTPSRSIASRMKGFFFSYLPTATKKTEPRKPAAPAHPGLPIPPPEVFQKPRPPIATPVGKPPPKSVAPKELVQLNHAPPPKPSRIPRFTQKPKRLVELHPAPPPEPRPRSSTGFVSDRRSSNGSVKDLVRSFETLEKQQERERLEEGARLRRARSVGEWASTAGLRGQAVQSGKPGWRP